MKLKIRCQGCGRMVAGSARATVHIPYEEFAAVQRKRDEWTVRSRAEGDWTPIGGTALMTFPNDAQWLIHCDGCNPHKDGNGDMCEGCYWFSTDRCSTSEDLLYLTAHLMGKNWLSATNWDHFISAAARTTGAVER